LPDNSIDFVAKQVGVSVAEIGFYDWDGRQIKRHRVEIRRTTGFRECSVADAEKLIGWLADGVCQVERRAEQVREKLLQDVTRSTPSKCWNSCANAKAFATATSIERDASNTFSRKHSSACSAPGSCELERLEPPR